MQQRGAPAGFSLVEMMVATLLLSAIALAVTETLVSAARARARNERWMQATQLATEGIEQLLAGHPLRPLPERSTFERRSTVSPWNGHSGVQRLEVSVSWDDGEAHLMRLATLARQ